MVWKREHIQWVAVVWTKMPCWCQRSEENAAFRSRDKALYSAARANLKKAIKDAKAEYKRKIEDHFTYNDPQRLWRGIQHLTNYKSINQKISHANVSLAEELNCFFACFEAKATETVTSPKPATNGQAPPFTIQEHRVRSVLRAVNPRKTAGPDGVTGRVLKECADQQTLQSSQRSSTCPCQQVPYHPAWSQQQLFHYRRRQSSVVLTTTARLHLPQLLWSALKGWFSSISKPASQEHLTHISSYTEPIGPQKMPLRLLCTPHCFTWNTKETMWGCFLLTTVQPLTQSSLIGWQLKCWTLVSLHLSVTGLRTSWLNAVRR